MVPTLVGRFQHARCDTCRVLWLIEPASVSTDTPAPTGNQVAPCRLCGQPLVPTAGDLVPPTGHNAKRTNAGASDSSSRSDVVTIELMEEIDAARDSLRSGDLVAVRWGGQVHVKRVAALAGDLVTARSGRLLINGLRIEDSLHEEHSLFPVSWLTVDQDGWRDPSRWEPRSADVGQGGTWKPLGLGRWSCGSGGSDRWLVYRHRSIDRGNVIAPVRDDYPFNVSITRKLFVVDRLRLSATVEAASTCDIEIDFWSESGSVRATTSATHGQSFEASFYDGEPCIKSSVSPEQPVAIRIVRGEATLIDLLIERQVEYRLRPHDERGNYPLTLQSGECFLLGDNVPISVDSRELGVISTSEILGRVIRREPASRLMVRRLP